MPKWVGPGLFRQVVEERRAGKKVDKLRSSFHRFDDAWEALKWLLSRNCERLDVMTRTASGEDYHLYRQAGDPIAGTPDIVVLFTYDENQVNLIDINAEECDLMADWISGDLLEL